MVGQHWNCCLLFAVHYFSEEILSTPVAVRVHQLPGFSESGVQPVLFFSKALSHVVPGTSFILSICMGASGGGEATLRRGPQVQPLEWGPRCCGPSSRGAQDGPPDSAGADVEHPHKILWQNNGGGTWKVICVREQKLFSLLLKNSHSIPWNLIS